MAVSDKALAVVGPALLRRAKWSFLGYGVVAYVGLRVARRFGIFGDYPDKAISFIDTQVKSKLGFGSAERTQQGYATDAQTV
jgi:hypothetical protein